MKFPRFFVLALAVWVAGAGLARADQTNVAVAANFTEPAKEIGRAFTISTGHEAIFSFGSSGQFNDQIRREAPFEVFLSADAERPKRLAEDGYAVGATRFAYAIGRLVLWSRDPQAVKGPETLQSPSIGKIAICNPLAAPYGAAAVQTMRALRSEETLRPKLVEGANIAQAFQFVDTGNAEVGFVALSQIAGRTDGSRWLVPQELHGPIRQEAVLLKRGADKPAAKAFVDFLKGPEARAIIEKYGYGRGEGG